MTQEIIELIVKVLSGLLAICGLWLVSFIKDVLKTKVEAHQASGLDYLIWNSVAEIYDGGNIYNATTLPER